MVLGAKAGDHCKSQYCHDVFRLKCSTMLITKEQFHRELNHPQERTINITFEGMSGVGKSFWSERMASAYSYPRSDVDTLISTHPLLSSVLINKAGEGVRQLGNFLGLPYEDNFEERERLYLEAERIVMTDLPHAGHVLDLSGSAIYHPDQMQIIHEHSLVIYLNITASTRKRLLDQNLLNPKPICWNGGFKKSADQTNGEAIETCFERLIDNRTTMYELFADVTIPETEHSSFKDIHDLTDSIKNKLE